MSATRLVLCMRWGTRYGAHYVNRLHAACRRHLTGNLQMVCFTDDAAGLDPAIDARPLPRFDAPAPMLWLPWRKMSLWRPDLPADLHGREALFLDLDVVVVGNLDALFEYQPGRYCVIDNWTTRGKGIGNTSVFRFTVGAYPHIHEAYQTDIERGTIGARIEQEYISRHMHPGDQVFWPAMWVRSFKEELVPPWPQRFYREPTLPTGARIVVFHGRPDPDEAQRGEWPAALWKKCYKHIRPVPWIASNW